MKKFVETTPRSKVGGLVVLAEPTNLKIWNAHRGLIEIYFSVQGKTGHAGRPESGKNAINGIWLALSDLRRWLEKFSDLTLGVPSLNVAYLCGGLNMGVNQEGKPKLGCEGNNIADYAEAVIDIRPTKKNLRVEIVIDRLKKCLTQNGYKMAVIKIRHNLGNLYTSSKRIKKVEANVKKVINKVDYLDPKGKGYGDGQLIQEKYGIPVVYIGPGGENQHAANECVNIGSLRRLEEIYFELIKNHCG
jgi:succinyl-diaminopimelate desuccinylase